jgi:hypothetical protein
MRKIPSHVLFLPIAGLLFGCSKARHPGPPAPPGPTLSGSFDSKFTRYHQGQAFAGAGSNTWSDTAWQGDRLHRQIVVWSNANFTGLGFQTSNLTSGNGSIPSTAIGLRTETYVLGDQAALACGEQVNRTAVEIADALSPTLANSVSAADPLKIWVTLNIPVNTPPGNYSGTIVVTVNDTSKLTFPLNILVVNKTLPPVADWTFHLDLWQFPFQLLTICNSQGAAGIVPFSPQYFSLVRPFYQLLADAGQTSITTYIKDGAFLPGQKMVKWARNSNGTWSYDFGNFDLFVDSMMSWGINREIDCFSPVGWQDSTIGYYDAASASAQTLNIPPGSPAFDTVWDNFLTAFKAHLNSKGWFSKAVLFMDELPDSTYSLVLPVIRNNDSTWKIGLAGSGLSAPSENSLYDYSTILGYSRLTAFPGGRIATFYTSCTQTVPNDYVTLETSPAEMPWMAWYAAQAGLDGYLRWAYDYWTSPDPTNIQDGSNSAGDYSLVYRASDNYPNAVLSSIRLDLLREGIQDFEKLQILPSGVMNMELAKFTSGSGSNAVALVEEAEHLLKQVSANQ